MSHQPESGSSVALDLQGLSYSVVNEHNKKETLHLLTDVTTYFQPGQMAALVRSWCSSHVYSELLRGLSRVPAPC